MIDLGLVDPNQAVGVVLDPKEYDQLKASGQFTQYRLRSIKDSSGRKTKAEAGLTFAQLVCPLSKQRVGPAVPLYACRGARGVSSHVGITFFHFLRGCRVLWDLGRREWCIEYP